MTTSQSLIPAGQEVNGQVGTTLNTFPEQSLDAEAFPAHILLDRAIRSGRMLIRPTDEARAFDKKYLGSEAVTKRSTITSTGGHVVRITLPEDVSNALDTRAEDLTEGQLATLTDYRRTLLVGEGVYNGGLHNEIAAGNQESIYAAEFGRYFNTVNTAVNTMVTLLKLQENGDKDSLEISMEYPTVEQDGQLIIVTDPTNFTDRYTEPLRPRVKMVDLYRFDGEEITRTEHQISETEFLDRVNEATRIKELLERISNKETLCLSLNEARIIFQYTLPQLRQHKPGQPTLSQRISIMNQMYGKVDPLQQETIPQSTDDYYRQRAQSYVEAVRTTPDYESVDEATGEDQAVLFDYLDWLLAAKKDMHGKAIRHATNEETLNTLAARDVRTLNPIDWKILLGRTEQADGAQDIIPLQESEPSWIQEFFRRIPRIIAKIKSAPNKSPQADRPDSFFEIIN